jgi:Cu2+-exporting ATPase
MAFDGSAFLPVAATRREEPARPDAVACFHCGEPVSAGTRWQAVVAGAARPMCCPGCSAVAEAIVQAGCESYYDRREAFAGSRREPLPDPDSRLRVFDREEIQRGFVSVPAEHEREASLILEGIRCPACIWLNETRLAKLEGVAAVHINYTTRRARVRWDARVARLSDILAAVEAIGYRAYPYDPGAMEQSRQRERRDALLRLAVAALGMMQVMMYAYPAYIAGAGDLQPSDARLMQWASLVLTLPVVAFSSWPFFRGAWADVRARRLGMDVPVALGVAAAFLASVAATVTGRGEVYFDSVAMFVCLLLGARYLELRARQRAAEHLEYLARSLPATAEKFDPVSGATETVPAGSLCPGDEVLVRTGDAFPVDGCIVQGATEVDESLITGECLPRRREAGQEVVGGAFNRGDPVRVRVTRVGGQTLLSGIVRLMERAAMERPRLQQIADRAAAGFVGFVLVAAAAAGAYWAAADATQVLPVVVAVLVVTCPCALSLAAPMVAAVSQAAMARRGVIVTRGEALETLARATHFVFDKTGTLTDGRLRVTKIDLLRKADRETVLRLAGALERHSEHPIGRGIAAAAGAVVPEATALRNHPGVGIEGVVGGRSLRIGQRAFVAQLSAAGNDDVVAPEAATAVWLGDGQGMLARIQLADNVWPDAAALIAELQRRGRDVMLFSGDSEHAVRAVAAQTGILRWRARMLPEHKQEAVRELQRDGAIVAMTGDGVNDAPVLAQAQVSIAMGSGALLAQGAADLVLASSRLSDLGRGYRLARKARRIVRENLAWAAAYNVVALPLAMTGWLTPWMAGVGMSASSLLVVLNALRAGRD